MQRFPLWCPLRFLLLTSRGDTHREEQESIRNYESCVSTVLNSKGSESEIMPFDCKLSVLKRKDNDYQYEIIISDPRAAMYNIQAIAIDPTLDNNSNVHPCPGLSGDDAKTSFNTIPYQAGSTRNFVSKVSLDGISEYDQLTLQVMVTWKDSKLINTSCVFFAYNYTQKDNEASG